MSSTDINIDRLIDYKTEYSRVLKKIKYSGSNIVSLCPFHNDTNQSFSVNLQTGKYDCFACGASGNYISFISRLNGISTKEAYKRILRDHGIEAPEPQSKANSSNNSLGSYSLAEYAFAKKIPEDWLKTTCHLSTDKGKDGVKYLKIPYLLEGGAESTYRKRYANKEFRWKYGSSGKICLYGDWRLPEIRQKGYCLMVEGESDTQTLWYLGFPTVGVAGANMFKSAQSERLQDLKLYIHQEPDLGGDTFVNQMKKKLNDGDFIGEVYVWSCDQFGVKDPSELYIKFGAEEATKKIQKAIKNAVKVDITEVSVPVVIDDAPVHLRTPAGWKYSDSGIVYIEPRTGVPFKVCRTPILITRRLCNIDTREEKVEVAFKRDRKWRTAIFPRSTIFQNKSIMALADLGCTVTSENAKSVVSFLGALEAENIDIIESVESASTFGWQPNNRFLPGLAENIVIDAEPSQRALVGAYTAHGTLDAWIENMRKHRERFRFRFIMAAAFAAPLLKILKQRIFFVYNWAESKGGKTAALKAALSAWGDPEHLMFNFNATQVALERIAAFYCDLPLGIDERQLAGQNQQSLEKIVYMIASGTGRARGTKNGGLQQTSTWRTIAIATGEEPLSTSTSHTGVNTRIVEIYGGPFDNEADASAMHQSVSENYGLAGTAFVKKLLTIDEDDIREKYSKIFKKLLEADKDRNASHVSGIAAVALADMYIDEWLFGGTNSEKAAMEMAENVIEQQKLSQADESDNVNENATQFIVDWVMSNYNNFGSAAIGTCLGFIEDECAYIFPTLLRTALTKAGYSARKTIKYLGEKNLIGVYRNGDHTTYSTVKRFGNKYCRVIEFKLEKAIKGYDDTQDETDFVQMSMDIENPFTQADGNEPLPF